MHDPAPEPARNPSGPDFSCRDIPVGRVLLAGVYAAVLTAAVLVGLRLSYNALERRARRADDAVASFVRDTRPLPPEPRLQVDEPVTWQRELDRQNAAISRYEWVDRNAGTIRIPVARAIDLLAERGLPAREEAP